MNIASHHRRLPVLQSMYAIMICRLVDFAFYDLDPMNRIRNLAMAAPGGVLFYLAASKVGRRKHSRPQRKSQQKRRCS